MTIDGGWLGGLHFLSSSLGERRNSLDLVHGDLHGSTTRVVAVVHHFKVAILYVGDDNGSVQDEDTLPR